MTEARQSLNSGKTTQTRLAASEFSDPNSGEARAAASTSNASNTSSSTAAGKKPVNTNLAFSGSSTDNKDGGNGDQLLAGSNFKPIPNPMGELFQPSYHFRFYLPPDIGTADSEGKSVTIAETGLTGMNIQDVNIESFIGPNIRTRNATATSLTIRIYEPLGNMLPDIMYQAAGRMAIANYLKAPWMLELKLHGYDEQGNYQVIDGSPWKWKLIMTDMQSQISESGTTHTITALPLMEVALNNQYCMIPVAQVQKGNTVGEVLKNIVDGLNKDSAQRYGGPPYFIEYAVEDVPYRSEHGASVARPFDHKVISDQPSKNDTRSAADRNTMQSQFAPGTDFPAMVDSLMAASVSAVEQTRVSRSIEAGKDGLDKEEEVKNVTSVMHRVDTKVELLDYHPVFGDYMRKITYIVRPYDSLRLLTSMGRATNFDKDTDLHLRKAAYATKRNFLKKQYDYIFTGLNTEIEKFDIVVNFRWAVMVPRLKGFNLYGNMTVPAEVADENQWAQQESANMNERANQIRELDSQLTTQTPKPDPNDPDAADKATFADGSTRAQLTAKLEELKAANQTSRDKLTEISNKRIDESKARRSEVLKGASNGEVIEDEVAAMVRGGDAQLNDSLSSLPITIHQDGDNPAIEASTGTSAQNNNGKSIYGSLLNQLYGSFDGNLQNISLDIKGDPYWLGPGVDQDVILEESTDTKPVFMNGEHMFAFRFKLPLGQGEDGRVVIPTDEDALKGNTNIFTGFYAAIRVIHKFSGGSFKQTLEATRIPGWQFEKILTGRYDPDDAASAAPANYDGTPISSNATPSAGTGNGGKANQGGSNKSPRGIRNNNPGNLRDSAFARRQPGYVGADASGFAQYDSAANGINAQERLLRYNYVNHPTTVSAVIERYAPSNENSAASRANYIRFVESRLGKSNVNASDAPALAAAMRAFENGVG